MKRLSAPMVALVLSVAVVFGVNAQNNNIPAPNPSCSPLGGVHLNGQQVPTTLEPEFSIWCYPQPAAIAATRVNGANDWVDTFDNSADAITHFDDHNMGYRVFQVFYGVTGFKSGYFVNVNHWMIDLADISTNRLSGGILVSPDRQFQFENGKFVVEVDAAAGSDGMGGANRFYEIDVTPAAQPSDFGVDSLYGYGSFGGVGAVGCRLERNDQGGNFVCSMYDNSNRVTGGECPNDGRVCTNNGGRPGRVWETQGPGTRVTAASIVGGYPEWPIPGTNLRLRDVWRQCADNELDLHCRDRFRMEITKDSIHLFVNGYPAAMIDGLFAVNPDTGADNRIPDSWFQQGVRPYFTSWVNGGQHTPTRWHWDRVAVNPKLNGSPAPLTAAPSFCLGLPDNTCPDPVPGAPVPTQPTALPTWTTVPASAATSTRTSTPTATATALVTPTATRTATAVTAPQAPPAAATATPVPPAPPSGGGGGGGGGSGAPVRSNDPPVLGEGGGGGGGGGVPFLAAPPAAIPLSSAPTPVVAPSVEAAAAAPQVVAGFHVDVNPAGGQLLANNISLLVPELALGADGGTLTLEPLASSITPADEGGFALGDTQYRVRLTDRASGEELRDLALPLTLSYRPTESELALAGGDPRRIHPALWTGSGWVALPCDAAASGAQTCSLSELNVLGVVVAPAVSSQLDFDLGNGHFYKQANGYSGAGESGFAVVDDGDAAFWSEFQRLGGVAQLGYPISSRFQFRGYLTQVFQKVALQWRPESNAAVFVNTLEELSQPGATAWLEMNRQVPPGPDALADAGLSWLEVVDRHLALLDRYPSLSEFYNADPAPIDRFGLPLSVEDYGPLVSVRLQRATLQLWTVDSPWAAAGTVVLGNSGDLAKEVGLWTSDALVPRPAGAFALAAPKE
jgi:hypothetical protein